MLCVFVCIHICAYTLILHDTFVELLRDITSCVVVICCTVYIGVVAVATAITICYLTLYHVYVLVCCMLLIQLENITNISMPAWKVKVSTHNCLW
jgi:hypothetical protein